MSDVRILHDPNRSAPVPSNGAPKAVGKDAAAARYALGEYLDAHLMRPLFFDGARQQQRVETALDTMTPAERVYLEIEMQTRQRQAHSYDYDPLR